MSLISRLDWGFTVRKAVMAAVGQSAPGSSYRVTGYHQTFGGAQVWLERQLDHGDLGMCNIADLLPAHSPRQHGEMADHVRILAESPSPLPPIVVHYPSMRVVDGMHRLLAAKLRGDSEIEVQWYRGDERDMFAVAVHTNVTHGLPLSLADRRMAAARIIESHPHWSDRTIASIVKLAPGTVRAIRSSEPGEAESSAIRIGRDGRARPMSTAAGRRMAGELLRNNPDSSLREIARATGLAPSTVHDVRKRLSEGRDLVPPGPSKEKPDVARPAPVDRTLALRRLRSDPSLRFTETGRILLRWLENGPTDVRSRTMMVRQLPSHSLATIAALARSLSQAWHEFVDQLEQRADECSTGHS